MPKILRITGKINLVYSMAPIIFSAFSGFVYSKFTKSIFVHEVSDIWPEELVIFKTNMWFIIGPIGKIFAKLAYVVPDIIVTISHLAAEYISKEYKPKGIVYVMPIGVDPSKFPRLAKLDSIDELVRAGIFPDALGNKFVILYSGIISSGTGVENIAYAADKLKDNKDIVFLIVGEGESKLELEKFKTEHSLTNFYLLPFQPRELVPKIISSSDICIVALPSEPIFDVDVPTKFYEYLACYKPLIALSQGEVAEIINSNNIGRAVKAGDVDNFVKHIEELKNSPELLKTIEGNCIKTLQLYSLDTISSSFLNLLKNRKGKKGMNQSNTHDYLIG
jgi:glycosyltransferase involved in cell wall biosynthesis